MPPPPKLPAPGDEALMARAADDGDTVAFATLYERHAGRAFRLAQAICRDPGRAEGIVQESFLAIWDERAKFCAEKASFKAWSMRIVSHRAIAAAHSEDDTLPASLGNLPAAQAEVIALAFFGELSHSEIAAQLGLPSGTVKGRMRLGLEKLRRQMSVPA